MSVPQMAVAKKARSPRKANREQPAEIDLRWDLAELPSSQHRAGLAGLVMVVRWLDRKPGGKRGTCDLVQVDAAGAALRLDLEGLKWLFDDIYAATCEEQERSTPLKDGKKQVIPPLREVSRQVQDGKAGKLKEKTFYVYPRNVPRGSFLGDMDKPADGSPGLWIKLWRDMIWNILRGKPAQRAPFDARAEGRETVDAEETWRELVDPSQPSVDLPSTYFIGAQATTAEAVPFFDRARLRFLLHFWPFAAQIYCPAWTNAKGERDLSAYAIAIPDVADLEGFCEELPYVLRGRSGEKDGYRPRESVIEVPIEGGLDSLRRLCARVGVAEGARATGDLVLGIDVVHLDKEGKNVRLRGSGRVEPDVRMIDEYARIRSACWDAEFRRRRVLNLVGGHPWSYGFDVLFETKPWERFFHSPQFKYFNFPHDAREAFKEANVKDGAIAEEPVTPEGLVYRIVGTYLSMRVEAKTQLRWEQVKADPDKKKEYNEALEKVAKNAFLAVRSRSGADFVSYFTATLCSVPHHLGEERYLALSKVLLTQPETIRTLTMLALSARG